MSLVPPHVSRAIQRRIDEIEDDSPGGWVGRACRHELNALPALANQVYVWALRPNGTVVCMDHESFSRSVEEVADPLQVHAVWQGAARRYPELREGAPAPPDGVSACDACGATGWTEGCAACEGMGWRRDARPIDA